MFAVSWRAGFSIGEAFMEENPDEEDFPGAVFDQIVSFTLHLTRAAHPTRVRRRAVPGVHAEIRHSATGPVVDRFQVTSNHDTN
jgi:hypothetical protein